MNEEVLTSEQRADLVAKVIIEAVESLAKK